ncbi:MAG TPA: hypothetical protein VF746_13575 [Longimicrobium sp.]|jgi:hypothetical protein
MQHAYRAHAQVAENGSLTLENLPFTAGEEVEVIVLAEARKAREQRYPLRGMPVTYADPTAPVAEGEWDALR